LLAFETRMQRSGSWSLMSGRQAQFVLIAAKVSGPVNCTVGVRQPERESVILVDDYFP
jgi:hypothetical protein